jgi:hypothetical protein
LVLATGAITATATDLAFGKLVFPDRDIQYGEDVRVRFTIDNRNVLAAYEYSVDVTIKDKIGGSVVFTETVQGTPVEPFTQVELVTAGVWIALVTGQYDLIMQINFDDEINPTNNSATYSINVLAKAIAMQLYYSKWIAPIARLSYTHGILMATIPPSTQWRYLNVVFAQARTALAYWLVQNILIPPWPTERTYKVNTDLSSIIEKDTPIPDTVYANPVLSSIPYSVRDSLPEVASIGYKFEPLTLSVSYGLQDTNLASINYDPTPIAPTSTPVGESVYYGCNVPNLDLNSSVNNPTSTPGFAGDLNACAPTAAANSMQWLENTFSGINSGLTHRQKLTSLSKCMKREDTTGVWIEDFIRGKLAYINKHNLPIKVKFQIRGLNENVSTWTDDDYQGEAVNQGTGAYPSFDYVKQELKDSEDVEVFVEYHDRVGDSSTVVGRHVITATGAAVMSDYNRFWYKDDGNQSAAGGTSETPAFWKTLNNNVPYIEEGTKLDGTKTYTVPYGVVSESPDYSRVRTEKGFLEKVKDGLLGLGARLGFKSDAVDWVKSHPIRFAQVVANEGGVVSKQDDAVQAFTPKWAVKNFPVGDVFGLGTYTLVDPSAVGVVGSAAPSELTVRILYTDKPVTTMPQFDSTYRTYPVDNTVGQILTGSNNSEDGTEAPPATGVVSTMPMPDGQAYSVTQSKVIGTFNTGILDRTSVAQVGGSSVSSFNAVVSLIKDKYPNAVLNDLTFDNTAKAFNFRTDTKGVKRLDVMFGMLNEMFNGKWLVSAEFQSIRLPAGDLPSPVSSMHHAKNASPVGGGITHQWMFSSLNANGPLLMELGWYDTDKRLRGTWVTVYGMVDHNGLRRVLMPIDFDEEKAGGLRWTVATLAEVDGMLYLPELSNATSRCHLETVISMKYDPTVVYTGVAEDLSREVYNLTVAPHPASDMLHISWNQAVSGSATAKLVNSVGKAVEVYNTTQLNGEFVWDINLQHLESGVYTIVVHTKYATITKPVVVLR